MRISPHRKSLSLRKMAAADETRVFTCERVAECPFLKGIDVALGTRDKESDVVMIIASKKTVQAMADLKKAYEEKEKKALYKQKKSQKIKIKERMESFMAGVDARFAALEEKILAQDRDIHEHKAEIVALKAENAMLKERICALEGENAVFKSGNAELKAENVALKARIGLLEARERHLAIRAVVSILRQLSSGPDSSATFRWLATLSKSSGSQVLCDCFTVPPELAVSFTEASKKGHAVAHSPVTRQLLEQQLGLMDETEKALAKVLIGFMEDHDVSVFESFVPSHQSGTP